MFKNLYPQCIQNNGTEGLIVESLFTFVKSSVSYVKVISGLFCKFIHNLLPGNPAG